MGISNNSQPQNAQEMGENKGPKPKIAPQRNGNLIEILGNKI